MPLLRFVAATDLNSYIGSVNVFMAYKGRRKKKDTLAFGAYY